jgi:hypothetical protein
MIVKLPEKRRDGKNMHWAPTSLLTHAGGERLQGLVLYG